MPEDEEGPRFVRLRGCINCDVSKACKEKHGTDYGFDHEIVIGCILYGCVNYGHDLANPFIDPEDVIRFVIKQNNPAFVEGARKYCLGVKQRFGEFYKAIGISIDDFVASLPLMEA